MRLSAPARIPLFLFSFASFSVGPSIKVCFRIRVLSSAFTGCLRSGRVVGIGLIDVTREKTSCSSVRLLATAVYYSCLYYVMVHTQPQPNIDRDVQSDPPSCWLGKHTHEGLRRTDFEFLSYWCWAWLLSSRAQFLESHHTGPISLFCQLLRPQCVTDVYSLIKEKVVPMNR